MDVQYVEDQAEAAEGYAKLQAEGARDGGVILCERKGHPCIFMWTDCDGNQHQEKVQPGKSLNVKIKKVVFEKGGVSEKCVSEKWKCPSKEPA